MDAQTVTQNTTRLIVIVVALALLIGGAAGATAGWIAGSNSAAGPAGADGVAGTDGIDGLDGALGSDGAPGLDGAPGKDGAPGPAGPRGLPGLNGSPGAPGTPGAQGPAGPAGPQGPPGADGQDGAPGATGLQGLQGIPGLDGDAAAPWLLLTAPTLEGGTFEVWDGLTYLAGDTSIASLEPHRRFGLQPGTYRVTLLAVAFGMQTFTGDAQLVPDQAGLPAFVQEFESGLGARTTINVSGVWDFDTARTFFLYGGVSGNPQSEGIGNIYVFIQQLD